VAAGDREVRRVGDDRGDQAWGELLRAGVLRMSCQPPVPWRDLEERLRPFVAQRVPSADVDDVIQDVFARMQRGLAGLRDDERFSGWLYQVARSAIAERGRARARHPLADDTKVAEPAAELDEDDRATSRDLSSCVAIFVAGLPSPYREAVTLVELEGLTGREAAALVGISVSGMKSRVQRGRARLREMFEQCCEIALDARGKVTEYTPRRRCQ
jgi:RNA polymerase sigma-70 factor (ECF subfamily)